MRIRREVRVDCADGVRRYPKYETAFKSGMRHAQNGGADTGNPYKPTSPGGRAYWRAWQDGFRFVMFGPPR